MKIRWLNSRLRSVASVVCIASVTMTVGAHAADRNAPAALGETADILEMLIEDRGLASKLPDPTADEDYYPRDELKEELGRLLFFDKILSGNLNTSCATCHHPLAWTGDGLSLPVGEGGTGLGVTRDTGAGLDSIHERVPRNAPHVFNLGARQFSRMFHDGRLEVDSSQPSGFRNPAGDAFPAGLDNVLSAQAMFPVTSLTEMAGQAGENPIANAAVAGNLAGQNGVWDLLAKRLRRIAKYRRMFIAAFDDVHSAADITFVHAANAIGAYEAAAYRADNSPFDRYLRGERGALSRNQKQGMFLFYKKARCGECHSGVFQSNQQFAAIGMPQVGPGKGQNALGYNDGHDDFGREAVTSDSADRYRFRVPTLRNVAATGPWGHDGAYNTLEAVVRHHMHPRQSLHAYDPAQCVMPSRPDLDAIDIMVQGDAQRRGYIADACELPPIRLSNRQLEHLIDFLHALTDPKTLDMRDEVPTEVPSGLPIWD